MTSIDVLGFSAAFLTTISFLPQAIRVIRTKDTSSLSLAMYSIFTIGVALWLCYGVIKNDYAMIVANGITLLLAALILAIKVHTEHLASRVSKVNKRDEL